MLGRAARAAGDRPLAGAAFRTANAVPFGSPTPKTPLVDNGELTGVIWNAKALPMGIPGCTARFPVAGGVSARKFLGKVSAHVSVYVAQYCGVGPHGNAVAVNFVYF